MRQLTQKSLTQGGNMNRRAANLFRLLSGLVLLAITVFYLYKHIDLRIIKNISIIDILISSVFAFIIFAMSGLLYRLLLHSKEIYISLFDTLTLPIAMNFWSYIIPLKGGGAYFIFFLKNKYKANYSSSVAITAYCYLVTIIITGMSGIFFYCTNDTLPLTFLVFSICFLFSPLGLVLWPFFYKRRPQLLKRAQINRLIHWFDNTYLSLVELLKNHKLSASIVVISTIRFLVLTTWFYWLMNTLSIETSTTKAFLLVMTMELTAIFKLIPGNLGVNELVTGGVMATIGGAAHEGILLAATYRISALSLTFTVGLISSIYNLKYFHISRISDLKKNILERANLSSKS